MTITLTAEEALDALDRAVELRGKDYVYPDELKQRGACVYVTDDGAPSCILGVVLDDLGVDMSKLPKWGNAAVFTEAYRRGYFPGLVLEDNVVQLLTHAQMVQDSNEPWGAARDKARREFANGAGR